MLHIIFVEPTLMNPWLQVAVTLGESSLTGAGDSVRAWKYFLLDGKATKDMLYIGRISDIIRSLSVWKSVLLPTVLDIESILTFLKTVTFH